jgi:hypothetical protein
MLIPAYSNVPFRRNTHFVGRSDDLERLHAALQSGGPTGIIPAGLMGMGGIGKTQLAVEYAYRYEEHYPDGVFWLNAARPLAEKIRQAAERRVIVPNIHAKLGEILPNLYDTEYGYSNGSSQCYGGSGGTIVAGVTNQILQGCT